MRQPVGVPTCPRCGHHANATRVDHPGGIYFCTCGQLFNGTDTEWHALTAARREFQERHARAQHREIPQAPGPDNNAPTADGRKEASTT